MLETKPVNVNYVFSKTPMVLEMAASPLMKLTNERVNVIHNTRKTKSSWTLHYLVITHLCHFMSV